VIVIAKFTANLLFNSSLKPIVIVIDDLSFYFLKFKFNEIK